nr:PP2C family protein-serine/threonine phosphatase [Oscillochloris trichoides]
MIAIISWLYQRELTLSAQRLEAARQKVLEGELLRRDLAVARELQQRLYPPPILTNSVISIASRSEPARETSGDFYDFIKLDAHRLGIVVADVTGKSIAAALVMAMARSTMRSEAARHFKPSEVLHYANQTLCNDNTFKELITAFYGVIDTRSLEFAFSNAGHPYPVLRRNGQLQEIEIGGLPLGSSPIALYSEQSVELQPGDQIILVSDGLYEEMNVEREMFGFPRMMEAIDQAHRDNPHQALSDIWSSVEIFRGTIEQSDDITLMVIQVTATPKQSHEP